MQHNKKVFAFFGSDLRQQSPDLLEDFARKGFILLALDTGALANAEEWDLPYTLMEDWIQKDRMTRALEIAHECESQWYEAARNKFTTRGICWPEYTHHYMLNFWREVVIAKELALAFRDTGVRELAFRTNPSNIPRAFTLGSVLLPRFWQTFLKDIARPLGSSVSFADIDRRTRATAWFRQIAVRAQSFRRRVAGIGKGGPKLNPSRPGVAAGCLQGAIAVFSSWKEWWRFNPIIEQLADRFTDSVVALFPSPPPDNASHLISKCPVPVLWQPEMKADPKISKRFISAYRTAAAESIGQPWEHALRIFPDHFYSFCLDTWSRLHAVHDYWTSQFERYTPSLLLASSNQNGNYLVPLDIAAGLGIPSFTIPHTGMDELYINNRVLNRPRLYNYGIQRKIYEGYGIKSHDLVGCKGLVVENAFPTVSVPTRPTNADWTVLVLTSPAEVRDRCEKWVTLGNYIAALRDVANPPEDMAHELAIRIKVHPRFPEMDAFRAADSRLADCVLPPECDLESALEGVDLVVALNYFGTALIHVLRAGKCVISFITEEFSYLSASVPLFELFLDGTALARTGEEFWSLVSKFFSDGFFADDLRAKCQSFSRQFLSDDDYGDISEVVKMHLGSGGPESRNLTTPLYSNRV